MSTERLGGHSEIQATADVPAPLICGRFHFLSRSISAMAAAGARNFAS
jgi:hypothetical protein